MSEQELEYGAVLITKGRYKGMIGYYDDVYGERSNIGKALVFLGTPLRSKYVLVKYDYICNVTSLEHEKFKKENPEYVKRFGIR